MSQNQSLDGVGTPVLGLPTLDQDNSQTNLRSPLPGLATVSAHELMDYNSQPGGTQIAPLVDKKKTRKVVKKKVVKKKKVKPYSVNEHNLDEIELRLNEPPNLTAE